MCSRKFLNALVVGLFALTGFVLMSGCGGDDKPAPLPDRADADKKIADLEKEKEEESAELNEKLNKAQMALWHKQGKHNKIRYFARHCLSTDQQSELTYLLSGQGYDGNADLKFERDEDGEVAITSPGTENPGYARPAPSEEDCTKFRKWQVAVKEFSVGHGMWFDEYNLPNKEAVEEEEEETEEEEEVPDST